jgi:hypothetical protein
MIKTRQLLSEDRPKGLNVAWKGIFGEIDLFYFAFRVRQHVKGGYRTCDDAVIE